MVKPVKMGIVRGELLCDPQFANRVSRLHIGAFNWLEFGKRQQPDIQVAQFHDRITGMARRGAYVDIRCGNHGCTVPIPGNIPINCSIDLKAYENEPILSILPPVATALMLWQRAYAKTDLTGDDIVIDSRNFDGILPIVVAAACRGVVILTDGMPKDGIYRSVCNLLHVDVSVKKPTNA